MSDRIRSILIVLLLALPVLALNAGFFKLRDLSLKWEKSEQEQQAKIKLSEIESNLNLEVQLGQKSQKFKSFITNVFNDDRFKKQEKASVKKIHNEVFKTPFPEHEIWMFTLKKNQVSFLDKFGENGPVSRRPMEIAIGHLINLEQGFKVKDFEARRNRKFLTGIFGSGIVDQILAVDQIGIPTPVIYRGTPSWLVWDYEKLGEGSGFGYFLVVKRTQDLERSTVLMVAQKSELGSNFRGGFISLFKKDHRNFYFPRQIKKYSPFMAWRKKIGFARNELLEWEKKGFPWAIEVGEAVLYTRIMPSTQFLAFLLMPRVKGGDFPLWLFFLNLIAGTTMFGFLARGLILNIWPASSLKGRFLATYLISVTIPLSLLALTSGIYIMEREKIDEKQVEEKILKIANDLELRKEIMETEYLETFRRLQYSKELQQILSKTAISDPEVLFKLVKEFFAKSESSLPLSSIMISDLDGKWIANSPDSKRNDESNTLGKFFSIPLTLNLRKIVSETEKNVRFSKFSPPEEDMAAFQSYARGNETVDREMERFRGQPFRMDIGRGETVYVHDYISVGGKNRFVLMISWKDTDIDPRILKLSTSYLIMKNPDLSVLAFKRTKTGINTILEPGRSFNKKRIDLFRKVAESAFAKKSGYFLIVRDGMTIVAYLSKNFRDVALIIGIDRFPMMLDHWKRVAILALVGFASLLFLVLSALTTYFRAIDPLGKIKIALMRIKKGDLRFSLETSRKDEIGVLIKEFGGMVDGLRERERLASILSDQAVEALSNMKGSELSNRAQKQEGVVLISDIRSFTAMCEQNDPKIITSLLNIHFAEMAEEIVSRGGRIYKFIGDAIEAVFLPESGDKFTEKPELRAYKAAVGMIYRLRKINKERLGKGEFEYQAGIGLAHGELTSGEIGSSDSRLDFAILGKPFKEAEAYEALTKDYSDCPIIFDEKILSSIEQESPEIEKLTLRSSSCVRLLELPPFDSVVCRSDEFIAKTETIGIEKENTGFFDNYKNSFSKLVFFFGAIALFLPFLVMVQKEFSTSKNKEKVLYDQAKSRIESTIAKFRVKKANHFLLEDYLDGLTEKYSDEIPWNKNGIASSSLLKMSDSVFKSLSSIHLTPSVYMCLHKPGDFTYRVPDENWQLIRSIGAGPQENEYLELLRLLAKKRYFSGYHDLTAFVPHLPFLIGKEVEATHLYNDMVARIIPIKRMGKDELLYWRPIFKWNPAKRPPKRINSDQYNIGSQAGPDAVIQVGILFILFPRSVEEGKLANLFLATAQEIGIEILVKDKSGNVIGKTNGFPDLSAKSQIDEKISSQWVTETSWIESGEEKYEIIAAEKLQTLNYEVLSAKNLFALLLLTFLLCVWYISVFKEGAISQRFSWQLWTGLLAASIVPICTIYMVNEWFAIEQRELRVKEERNSMLHTFERLERRQYLHEPLDWHQYDCISNSKKVLSLANIFGNNPTIENKEKLKLAILEEEQRYNLRDGTRFMEMMVCTNKGEQTTVNKNEGARESSAFRKFVEVVVNSIFKDLKADDFPKKNQQNLGAALKGEMTRDAGLSVARTLLGSDNYFKVVHGLNLPIKVFAASGLAYLKLIAAPSLIKPDAIFFWLYLDDLNSSCRRIAKDSETDYDVFSESRVMYGSFKFDFKGRWFRDASRMARWAHAQKSNFSERIKLYDREYLVEAKTGSYNEVMIWIGLASLDKIFKEIEDNRKSLLDYLLLTMAGILFLALLASSDLTSAIKNLTESVRSVASGNYTLRLPDTRRDEIGELFTSFNSMARGLEEKEIMGTMVSRIARLATTNEENVRDAEEGIKLEVAVMYLAIPEFSFWLTTLNSSELVCDLKNQVDLLCKIIINNGGDIDKIIGEKMLAVFYNPEGIEESIKSAMNALTEIRNSEREGVFNFPITVGLHSGEVIAGLLGVGKNRDFTIIGDTVNTAARISAKASELPRERFLVGKPITEFAQSKLEFREFGFVELKGKAEQVSLYLPIFR